MYGRATHLWITFEKKKMKSAKRGVFKDNTNILAKYHTEENTMLRKGGSRENGEEGTRSDQRNVTNGERFEPEKRDVGMGEDAL